MGDWYFLALKAFRVKDETVAPLLNWFLEDDRRIRSANTTQILPSSESTGPCREQYEKRTRCRFCGLFFSAAELPNKLSLKLLIQTEKQLRVGNSSSR